VDDALDAEQVEWILSHHERPDGRGYPRGLVAEQLSEGAALMAAADAFDVMVSARPYSPGRSVEAALAEVKALIGAQFTAEAAEALFGVHEADDLAAVAA
jgi:HD-GYP domain-containing protein (c-di-GMP phosphodiesterase class II)